MPQRIKLFYYYFIVCCFSDASKKQFVTLSQLEAAHIRIAGGCDVPSRLPTKGFWRKKVLMKNDEMGSPPAGQGAEAILIKTTKPVSAKGGKQPTVIPLTKEQIDAVLRSLKVPVPVSKGQVVDATTQSSPVEEQDIQETVVSNEVEVSVEMQVLNEKTPVVTINTPEKGTKRPATVLDSIPLEKRVKLDFPSPCSGDENSPCSTNQDNPVLRFRKKVIDSSKPSPQRALHLAPEFANPSDKNMTPSGDATNCEQLDSADEEKKPVTKKIEIIINECAVQSNSLLNVTSPNNKCSQKSVVIASNTPVSAVSSPSARTVVQLTNQPATILQLPFVNYQGQGQQKLSRPIAIPVSMPGTFPHNIQILHDGQQMIQLPVMLNQNNSELPSNRSNITVTNLQLIPQSAMKGANPAVTTLVRPVATKATASPNAGSQILAPQVITQSPITYLSKTPGRFIPISSAAVSKLLSSNHSSDNTTSGSIAVDSL